MAGTVLGERNGGVRRYPSRAEGGVLAALETGGVITARSRLWVQPHYIGPTNRSKNVCSSRGVAAAPQLHLVWQVTDQPLAERVVPWRLVTTG